MDWNRTKRLIFDNSARIPEIYGTFIALGLTAFFFLFHLLGLVRIFELRLLNVFIMWGGLYFAMKQYKRTHDGELTYYKGVVVGLATAFIGASTFVLILFFYLKLNPDFMLALREREPLGVYMNEYVATFAVWFEGIFSGMIITFILTNYLYTIKHSH